MGKNFVYICFLFILGSISFLTGYALGYGVGFEKDPSTTLTIIAFALAGLGGVIGLGSFLHRKGLLIFKT